LTWSKKRKCKALKKRVSVGGKHTEKKRHLCLSSTEVLRGHRGNSPRGAHTYQTAQHPGRGGLHPKRRGAERLKLQSHRRTIACVGKKKLQEGAKRREGGGGIRERIVGGKSQGEVGERRRGGGEIEKGRMAKGGGRAGGGGVGKR